MTEDKTTEFENTKWLADKLLNEPNADPDDDLRQLSRQFLRAIEREAVARQDERRKVCEGILEKLPPPLQRECGHENSQESLCGICKEVRAYNLARLECHTIITQLKSNP